MSLDPLVGLDDPRKPLRSRLLSVPSLRARYLEHARTLAERELDWKTLGPTVARQRALISPIVKADTRKLSSFEAFERVTADTVSSAGNAPGRGRMGMPLRTFAEERRRFLLADRDTARKTTP